MPNIGIIDLAPPKTNALKDPSKNAPWALELNLSTKFLPLAKEDNSILYGAYQCKGASKDPNPANVNYITFNLGLFTLALGLNQQNSEYLLDYIIFRVTDDSLKKQTTKNYLNELKAIYPDVPVVIVYESLSLRSGKLEEVSKTYNDQREVLLHAAKEHLIIEGINAPAIVVTKEIRSKRTSASKTLNALLELVISSLISHDSFNPISLEALVTERLISRARSESTVSRASSVASAASHSTLPSNDARDEADDVSAGKAMAAAGSADTSMSSAGAFDHIEDGQDQAEEAQRKAEEAQRKAEEARRRAEAEAQAEAERVERAKQAEEARRRAEAEAEAKAERARQAEEARRRAEAEAQAEAERVERAKQAEEARRKAEAEAEAKAERARQAEEARRNAEAEAEAKKVEFDNNYGAHLLSQLNLAWNKDSDGEQDINQSRVIKKNNHEWFYDVFSQYEDNNVLHLQGLCYLFDHVRDLAKTDKDKVLKAGDLEEVCLEQSPLRRRYQRFGRTNTWRDLLKIIKGKIRDNKYVNGEQAVPDDQGDNVIYNTVIAKANNCIDFHLGRNALSRGFFGCLNTSTRRQLNNDIAHNRFKP